ncbi:MAG: hypothetical protein ACK4NX_02205, partial [Candidatus Paceibacteria bacterium]
MPRPNRGDIYSDITFDLLPTLQITKLTTIPESYNEIKDHSIALSNDLKHVAYPVYINGIPKFVVFDDTKQRPYDEVSNLTFSQDGKHLAYRAKLGPEWFMVLDGKEEKHYDAIGDPVFSPDSLKFAYVAYSSQTLLQFAVINGAEWKGYDGVWGITFSNDSKQIGYLARSGNEVFAVLNRKEQPHYKAAWAGEFIFSEDGSQHAYVVTNEDGSGFLVLNGTPGKTYDGVGQPVFSPDGRTIAYVASKSNEGFVVRDSVEGRLRYNVRDGRINIRNFGF